MGELYLFWLVSVKNIDSSEPKLFTQKHFCQENFPQVKIKRCFWELWVTEQVHTVAPKPGPWFREKVCTWACSGHLSPGMGAEPAGTGVARKAAKDW